MLVPYLRGYGPTRFLSAATPRSGEQAALGHDLLQLMDALGIARAALAGYDWGGRAACVVAALWPERVRCLVSCTGYNIQNIAASGEPAPAEQEHRYWYQYYFHTERGRAGLAAEPPRRLPAAVEAVVAGMGLRRRDLREAAPSSFDNPDFVEVVIQSYRHRYGYAPGDPALAGIDAELARAAEDHGADHQPAWRPRRRRPGAGKDGQAKFFSGSYERRVLPRIGHNVPQEAPAATVAALRDLMKGTTQ